MNELCCGLEIWSDKSLEEIAEIVSQSLLGGVRFVGKEECIRDEVPAVYAERDLFGLHIVLQGHGGKDGYYLEMRQRRVDAAATAEAIRKSVIDISGYVSFLLREVEGISVSLK